MAREFVRNPESGKAAVVVTNYQDVEMGELEDAVNVNQRNLDEIRELKAQKIGELDAINDQETKALAVLEDSKSELEAGQRVVADANGQVDAGTEAGGGADPDGNSEPATQL